MWVSHADTISGLALSPDRLLLYSISWDRTIKVWRTSDFKCLKSIEDAHDDAINAIVVSKDGTVYTGSADAKIKVWKKNALVMTLQKHSGSADRTIRIWRREGDGVYVCFAVLEGHLGPIKCLVAAAEDRINGRKDVDDGNSSIELVDMRGKGPHLARGPKARHWPGPVGSKPDPGPFTGRAFFKAGQSQA
ncbi:hypothetical protein QJS10_CPA08g01618 [Acorus calamus]|uniref:Uncharacterized protein n=1 Tax=Acorus calamus TaxID=4465 RepID=A0AAV9EBI7_ACOCL|nr:hypothetical protein QJS10_CPA08g01618 [Acorus calamus]